MNRYFKTGIQVALVALLSFGTLYHTIHFAHANETLPDPAVAVLSMDGPGGQVRLGDEAVQARKVFPKRKGASENFGGRRAYARVGGEGWGWYSHQPQEIFETVTKNGKVTNLLRAVVLPSMESQRNLVEITLLKCDEPTRRAEGKFFTVYAWDAKPNARFLLVANKQTQPQGVLAVSLVGDQEDLKKLGFGIDNLQRLVDLPEQFPRKELVPKDFGKKSERAGKTER